MMRIKLDFIPEQQRHQRTNLAVKELGGMPGEIVVGGVAAFAGILLLLHLFLAAVAVYKLAAYKVLEVRWNGMSADKKVYDTIADELKMIQGKMRALGPVASAQDFRWGRLLNDISDSVPKGVWLRAVTFDRGILTVQGSSVSKMNSEMVEAGNFVAALKARPAIRDNFVSVDIDSIRRRENIPVAVADFVLKAKRK